MNLYKLHNNPEELLYADEFWSGDLAAIHPKGMHLLLKYGMYSGEVHEIGNNWYRWDDTGNEEGVEIFEALCIIANKFPRYTESFKEHLIDDASLYGVSEVINFALNVTKERWPELEEYIVNHIDEIGLRELQKPDVEEYEQTFNMSFEDLLDKSKRQRVE